MSAGLEAETVWKCTRCGCRNSEEGSVGVGAEAVDIKLEVWKQKQ